MQVQAVVNIGPRNSGRMSPVGEVKLCDSRPFDHMSSVSEKVSADFNPSKLLSHRGCKSPTVISVTPQKSRPPSVKVYESPHATMWLTPEPPLHPNDTPAPFDLLNPFRSPTETSSAHPRKLHFPVHPSQGIDRWTGGGCASETLNLPVQNPLSHRSVSCRVSGSIDSSASPQTPGSGFSPPIYTTRVSKSKKKSHGVSTPSNLNLNYGKSSDPGHFMSSPPFGLDSLTSTPVSSSPRVTGPQLRVVPSPNLSHGFILPRMSMDDTRSGSPMEMPMPELNLCNPVTLTRERTGSRKLSYGSGVPESGAIVTRDSESRADLHRSEEDQELTTLPELCEADRGESPPDRVVAKYTSDLNIIKIHEAILTRFAYEQAEIPDLQAGLQISHREGHAGMTINERRKYLQTLESQQARLHELQNRTAFNTYIQSSLSILKAYKLVSSDASKGIVSIRKLGQNQLISAETISNRLQIIQQYLEIARDYISLDVVQINQIKARCPGCGVDFSEVNVDEDSGLCICDCGVERENLSQHGVYKDSTRVNIGNRNNYEDWENFEKALIRYQGRQQNKPPQKLYDQLDSYYLKIKKSLGAEIRSRPYLFDGKKEGTSRQMMLDALCETNNSAYYDDVNLVMNVYWGWKLPDVAHLESQIMQDYYLTQQIYNSEPHQGRDASLNTQFRLYVHLLAVGHRCSRDDFKIQTSRDSLEFHQEMWKKMCDKTGVKFHPVI